MSETTIFALSSGALPSGVAVVRVSGPQVRFVLETLVDSVPEPRKASLRFLKGADGTALDRGLVFFFPGPGSYTGEDVAEFHIHGGRAVLAAVIGRLTELPGLRPAEPGEFTRRAFEAGRLDLTEVEGLADLIGAETEAQRRQAIGAATGAARATIDAWRDRILRARAWVEAELDFPDEEGVPAGLSAEAWVTIEAVVGEIDRHLEDGRRGERLRDGADVVLVGAVNAGKSSLINVLSRRDVAIVSAEPGTTRDLIEVRLDIDGYPFTLVDTAGLRDATGVVEREGIRRARERLERADVVLALEDVTASAAESLFDVDTTARVIRIGTKVDLVDSEEERNRLARRYDVLLSSRTGQGIDELIGRLAAFASAEMRPRESVVITRSRHRSALTACRDALRAALGGEVPLELRAEELRKATDALGRLTGRVDVEDLLDVIFRDFCVGK
ncbi:MAG TPA: tRNA uridine-5-carboxymethylaminomethyl(34) synthesis GTPase MnmE [Bauldia sp.]|nr:tRNA uridine-5-carboxymethylaminomethyl(34) synthesis GTPase MnmE [Bauldia sp.]